MRSLSRKNELNTLLQFCEKPKPGVIYVRGRRRVGKSWLLNDLKNSFSNNCFLFSGKADSTDRKIMVDFILNWDTFIGRSTFSKYKLKTLTWSFIFETIGQEAQDKSLILILDEIQWIATGKSGFIGSLKEAWVKWERETNIKLIICGSSARFFSKFVGGEEKILRGIQTHSDLWVNEFPLSTVCREVVPNWKPIEVALLYMMLGGVPYYLSQIDKKKGFVRAINDAIYTKNGIFLKEWQEILSIDFNKLGTATANKVMSTMLLEKGSTLSEIALVAGLSEPHAREMLMKLQEYGYVAESKSSFRLDSHISKNTRGTRYWINDFYLQFYFSILKKSQSYIEENNEGLIFPRLTFYPVDSYYIPNFSGRAFERLVAKVIGHQIGKNSTLAKKLHLTDHNFIVHSNVIIKKPDSSQISSEIDILVEHLEDRTLRAVECKWTQTEDKNHLLDILSKEIPHYHLLRYLAVSYSPSSALIREAEKVGVTFITLEDLINATSP